MNLSVPVLVVGLTTGLTYAIIAMGLVLIYKASRFINFAHGQLGALSALLLVKFVYDFGQPYWLAFAAVLAFAGVLGFLVDVAVIRRLSQAPPLVLMVASIGIAQVLFAASFLRIFRPNATTLVRRGYPLPVHWTFRLGDQVLGGKEIMILLWVPIAAVVFTLFFRYTGMGLRIQAVASNREAARLAGISVRRVSTVVWIIAGVLAALTAVLLGPSRGSVITEALGPGLMTRALTAALVGSMVSLPIAFAAGIGLGVVEQIVFINSGRGGTTELVVFSLMLAVLLWRAGTMAKQNRRAEEPLPLATRPRPLPADVRDAPWLPTCRRLARLALLALVLCLPFVPGLNTNSRASVLTDIGIYALLGVSLLVVVGWTGQLSLGHFAFVGLGAYLTARLAAHGFSLPFVVLVVGAVGAGVAIFVGLPSLRVRGLFLGVSTLGFAVLAPGWLFNQSWFSGSTSSVMSVPLGRIPGLGEIGSSRGLYYVAVVLVVGVMAALSRLPGSGVGRRLMAVRDNSRNAAAHGLWPSGVNLAGFALSGFIATTAGALFGYAHRGFDANFFPANLSLALLSMVVIGGLGSMAGAVLGATAIFGLPLLLHLDPQVVFWVSGVGLVVTLLANPNGLVTQFYVVRDASLRAVARIVTASELAAADPSEPALECRDVTVHFAGLTALDHVSLGVRPGEIVGLIGANGAGKTTLMDCISGFLTPAEGEIRVHGRDIAGLPPEYRPYYGVSRTFQDARLYPGLTVFEAVLVAFERDERAGLFSSLIGAPWQRWSERNHRVAAEEVLRRLDMWAHRETLLSDLPSGLRRVCDLAAVLVQRPDIVLLDEPTAGIPQSDVQTFAPLIKGVRDELGCAMVIIEHDMGLVTSLADRIYALEAGRVIAEGSPIDVAIHPAVIASYLGDAQAAIERSAPCGAVSTNGKRKRTPTLAPRPATESDAADGLPGARRRERSSGRS